MRCCYATNIHHAVLLHYDVAAVQGLAFDEASFAALEAQREAQQAEVRAAKEVVDNLAHGVAGEPSWLENWTTPQQSTMS